MHEYTVFWQRSDEKFCVMYSEIAYAINLKMKKKEKDKI
jgi:hypothetical protein